MKQVHHNSHKPQLTFQTRKTEISKQVFVIQRGKRENEDFLYPVNHLNRRKSPSAPLLSKEKLTILDRVFPHLHTTHKVRYFSRSHGSY